MGSEPDDGECSSVSYSITMHFNYAIKQIVNPSKIKHFLSNLQQNNEGWNIEEMQIVTTYSSHPSSGIYIECTY